MGGIRTTKVLCTIWILWCAAVFPSARVCGISWYKPSLPIVPYTITSQLVTRRENNAGDLESVPIESESDHEDTAVWDSSSENKINGDTLVSVLSAPSLPSAPAWYKGVDPDSIRRKRVLGIEIPDVIAFHQPKSPPSRVALPFSMNVSLQNLRKLSQGLHKSGRRR